MIEVFKTNIRNHQQAALALVAIRTRFKNYEATLDLEDCDKILRVQNTSGKIESDALIRLLYHLGFDVRVFPDDVSIALYR